MNVWKPIAILSMTGLVASIGIHVCSANVASAETESKIEQANIGNCHNQPNMLNAARSLYAARDSLNRAEHNKGGWRERAVIAATNAIHETETGCAYADTH
jgi:hypothetical protein